MEQQKLLWIILSVAILFLAIIGAGMFVLFPMVNNGTGAVNEAAAEIPKNFDPFEWQRADNEYPGVTEKKEENKQDDVIIVYGEAPQQDIPAVQEAPVVPVPEKSEEKIVISSGNEIKTETVVVKIPPKQETKKVEAAPVKNTAASSTAKTAPAKTPAPAAAPKEMRPGIEYWIQVGSFSTLAGAEKAKDMVAEKGFTASIRTTVVDDKNFYRVRIGPYPEEKEADKFLYWVKEIDGFNTSYVSKVYNK